jgi:hypothetical protein
MRASSIIVCQLCNWRAKYTADTMQEVIFGLGKVLNQHNADNHLPTGERNLATVRAVKDAIKEVKEKP